MENYQVIQTYNGKEACEVMQKVYPSLIISDVMMPVMDGLELTRRVKQDINTSHIPVILLTAKTDEGEQTQGYLCGRMLIFPNLSTRRISNFWSGTCNRTECRVSRISSRQKN